MLSKEEKAMHSAEILCLLIEMINRTFAEDDPEESREKLISSLYYLEDCAQKCKREIESAFDIRRKS